jgi:acetyltransferase-like isoleucine patch superfamily enzyme
MMSKDANNIFERLKNGETISQGDAEMSQLRMESYQTISLVQRLNNSADPTEINHLLNEITGKNIDSSVAIFPPININNGRNLAIGKNVFINFDCTFLALGGITIEDDVLIGPKVSLITEGHSLNPNERHGLIPGKILIKKNAWIGANVTILPNVTIGENSVVAAGALVTKDVPPNVVVAGIPAKIIKTIENEN